MKTINRRGVLASLTAMGGFGLLSGRADSAFAAIGPLSLREAARDAWLYCLPLIEMAGARARGLVPLPGVGSRVNRFGHARALSGPANRGVTTPNNDTLYSSAWIDLSGEPVTLIIPPTGERYFSLALMDMYSNNFAVLGTRTLGGEGGTFTLAGPRAPAEPGAIRSPTNWVWALGRTLVDGPQDLAAAHAVQDGLQISARAGGRLPGPPVARDAAWNAYFGYAQVLLQDNSPPVSDLALFRRVRALQLGPSGGFERARFSNPQMDEAAAGVDEAREILRQAGGGSVVQGWSYPDPQVGDFGQNYLLRARTALSGLAALPPQEAIYLRPKGPDGRDVFDGPAQWRLRLPGPLPVDGFWSLTLYEATPDGQFFLTQNRLNRYAIGDRTPDLLRGENGSIDLLIGRNDPGGSQSANWLPAPATGPWSVVLRAYLPKAELLDGRYRVPAMVLDGDDRPLIGEPADPGVSTPTPTRRRRRRR